MDHLLAAWRACLLDEFEVAIMRRRLFGSRAIGTSTRAEWDLGTPVVRLT